jgi:YfiH family protein
MKNNTLNGFEYLSFERLDSLKIKNAFTKRKGGFSNTPFDTLNLGHNTNDVYEKVLLNYERLFNELNISKGIGSIQTHSDNIYKVEESNEKFMVLDNFDGFVTDQKGIALITTYADCTPIYFYDPKKSVIGIVHSGYKGTFKRISVKLIDIMINEYGCFIDDIIALIGPTIQKCHFEVSKDFLEINNAVEFEQFLEYRNEKYYFDLLGTNINILVKKGIKKENIVYTNKCTYCDSESFFSFRRDGINSGRMVALIEM